MIRIVADEKFYTAIGGGSEKNVSTHTHTQLMKLIS